MPLAGFESAIPGSELLQTQALDLAATGIDASQFNTLYRVLHFSVQNSVSMFITIINNTPAFRYDRNICRWGQNYSCNALIHKMAI